MPKLETVVKWVIIGGIIIWIFHNPAHAGHAVSSGWNSLRTFVDSL